MSHSEKQIMAALTISSILIIFNIIAVMMGKADIYYSHIEQLITNLLHQL